MTESLGYRDPRASKERLETLWDVSTGEKRHQVVCAYDFRKETLAVAVDRKPIGDVVEPATWRRGAKLEFEVDTSRVVVTVRPFLGISQTDLPVVRVVQDGAPIVSVDAREISIHTALISLPLPIFLGVLQISELPRAAAGIGLVVLGAVGLLWAIGIAWLGGRRWVDIAPPVERSRGLPLSLVALAVLLVSLELFAFRILDSVLS
jgi:hypothetical protein